MSTQPAIRLDSVSKKFATSLKRAMAYGMHDIFHQAMRTSPAHLSAEDVELRKGEFWAVRDLSLEIQPGERVGIIGHNGAGKSTLLSMLCGIYGPSTGRIEIQGSRQALIELGAGFHPKLTGLENIYINGAILGLKRHEIEKKVEEIVEFADIGDFIHAPVKTYSSGMLVRLGFGVAVAIHPDIMVIDEVLAVGDAAFQTKCVGYSQRLAEEGKTVVMVSHQLPHVQRICQRVLWMDHGRLVMDGPADEVIRDYSSAMLKKAGEGQKIEHSVNSEQISFSFDIHSVGVPEEEIPEHAKGDLPVCINGYDLVVDIDYQLHQRPVGKLNFWVYLKDAFSGVRVMGSTCWDEGVPIQVHHEKQTGNLKAVFKDVALGDGLYNVHIGVADATEAGESKGMAGINEQNPSFIVLTPKSKFKIPFSSLEGCRTPLVNAPLYFEHGQTD